MNLWVATAIGAGVGVVAGAAVLYATFRWHVRKWEERNE